MVWYAVVIFAAICEGRGILSNAETLDDLWQDKSDWNNPLDFLFTQQQWMMRELGLNETSFVNFYKDLVQGRIDNYEATRPWWTYIGS